MAKLPIFAQLVSSTVTVALGEERARALRARGADMDWDQAVAYTIIQAIQVLDEPQSATQPRVSRFQVQVLPMGASGRAHQER